MFTLTPDSILALNPCFDRWPKHRIEKYFAGRASVPLTDILHDAENLWIADRMWVGVHLLSEVQARLFACECAERVIQRDEEENIPVHPFCHSYMQAAKDFVCGQITPQQIESVHLADYDPPVGSKRKYKMNYTLDAAQETTYKDAHQAALYASLCNRWSFAFLKHEGAVEVEEEWQINRIMSMLEEQ